MSCATIEAMKKENAVQNAEKRGHHLRKRLEDLQERIRNRQRESEKDVANLVFSLRTHTGKGKENTTWYIGGKINIAYNCVEKQTIFLFSQNQIEPHPL